MSKITSAVMGAILLGATMMVAGAAHADWKADCSAKVKELQGRWEAMPSQAAMKEKVRNLLEAAMQGVTQGKKKKCQNQAAKADKIMSNARY